MKSALGILLFLAAASGIYSCKKTIQCERPYIKEVLFHSSLSSAGVPDTAAVVNKFNAGSNFSQLSESFPKILLDKEGTTDKILRLPNKGEETYDYDWEITLQPSNRKYYISKMSDEGATSKTHYCISGFSYRYGTNFGTSDSLVTVPGNPYSTTPYYPSQIDIEYW